MREYKDSEAPFDAVCCICGKIWRKSVKGLDYRPDHYAVHGRGKSRVVNYFHRDCFYENTIMMKGRR